MIFGLLKFESGVWSDVNPIRSDLFGPERLERHAESLAAAQTVTDRPLRVPSLTKRLKQNSAVLLAEYRSSARALQSGRIVTPAAEWLLDNYHLVEQQLSKITDDLPLGYYRQLPKLADGPLVGYPRVLGLAWAYVAHTDSLISGLMLSRFVQAYQKVQPLDIGELWAVAITLRFVLVENMRRLAVQITAGHQMRVEADDLVDRVFGANQTTRTPMHIALAPYEDSDLSEILAAQMAKRLRGFDPAETPLRVWLEDRLRRQDTSIDQIVQNALHRQSATNVTMRNIVTSMRVISELDWADFFEEVSLVDTRLRERSEFGAMDFATRNRYRTEIEILARGSALTEIAVTDKTLALSEIGANERERDPGHALIGAGRPTLQSALGFTPSLRVRLKGQLSRLGLAGYIGAIAFTSALILIWALWQVANLGVAPAALVLLALFGLGPAFEAATAVVNMVITRTVRPKLLPALDLASGIPDHFKTLVAVPVLLSDVAGLTAQIEQLEVHHLSSAGGALYYALLSDGADAASETIDSDAGLIAAATEAIARLNASYPLEGIPRFLLLHRRRQWNAQEGCWMGWERKRGKLHELNRLLRGANDTSFLTGIAQQALPQDVRYVITLDADTRLPRDTVHRLIGKMAHPLNRAQVDAALGRVTIGYGIVQPRVVAALPVGHEGSIYQQVFSGPGGIEPYAAANSDVYQDLFAEGSFTGKGIYDVDAFEAAIQGRVPDNTMLSHDLFEGIFARAALASDIDVIEDYPAQYNVSTKRQHRWVRGDWQLLPWLFGACRADKGGISAVGRWKMIDNLRRSATVPMCLVALAVGWLLPLSAAIFWTSWLLALLALPRILPLPFALVPGRAGIDSRSHFTALARDTWDALRQIALGVVLLADSAWLMLDAIGRTLVRIGITRQHLLEWMTAAQVSTQSQPNVAGHFRQMFGSLLLAMGISAGVLALNGQVWFLVLPFVALWLAAPAIAWRISQPVIDKAVSALSRQDADDLRLISRRTWRYFETFVTASENFMPPDNFQETPRATIAHRTSPTNIGLYLLATVVARDMGWIGQKAALERLEATLAAMQRLPRFRGHFYNWYDTRDFRVLNPPYISSVDSGNLAGHLIAVAQSCREWRDTPTDAEQIRLGLGDTLRLAQQALGSATRLGNANATEIFEIFDDLESMLAPNRERPAADLAAIMALTDRASELVLKIGAGEEDLVFWTTALGRCVSEHLADQNAADLKRLEAVATLAHEFAVAMEFGFLLNPDKKLLSIGFSVETNSLDENCYDLLASEARLSSLFAIAKGDVETRHWFRLGRGATPLGSGSALISWSGSMFEYLMPSLVMRAPEGSVLAQTNRLIVARQQAYGRALDIPWGISESSYNARDLEMTYQYSNFGVPGLGLKRGLSENRVIAPYATGLAAMVDPSAARHNFAKLKDLGAEGRFGFYEALDFTSARLPEGDDMQIVRSFMAHHQGMTITAIANSLQDGRLRARFHAEPMIRAVELLLQERVPRDVATAHPRAEEVLVGAHDVSDMAVVRRFDAPDQEPPTVHVLSNGRYSVMLTPTGAGFSRWRDIAITRWRAFSSPEAFGSFIFVRDTKSGAAWSAAVQPTRADAALHRAVFCEHHAAFTHQGAGLTTTTEIVISSETDAEARRVTLTNSGRRAREIDLTSYAELVLAPFAADLAHPAFSKMFVVTDYLPELEVIIATRRRRSPGEAEIWAAHIAVVEGEQSAPVEIETDRARFIGRGNNITQAAMAEAPLSGTTGTVLDPIFSIRRRVIVPPGGIARVTFWTMVADSSADLLDLVDRHRDAAAFERAATLAWTEAQVLLRHLGVTNSEASDFQKLAGFILRGDSRLRSTPARVLAGAGAQSGLWLHGISGDLPIVLFLIDDTQDIGQLKQVLAAHEYWRTRQLHVDLVILNERASSYVQDLHIAVETAVRSAQLRPRSETGSGPAQGSIYTLRADLISAESRALLLSSAKVVLVASRGSIGEQIEALQAEASEKATGALTATVAPVLPTKRVPDDIALPELEFFNGFGGFAENGREYVTVLRDRQTTPAPWINVIANRGFGFQVSVEGSGYAWAENSRENQLTPWSNDPVTDRPGEAVYLRDLDSGAVWSPTALPIRGPGTYVARHGFGYSGFDYSAHEIAASMVQFVPLDDPVRISRLTLVNRSSRVRHLSVTHYAEWVLGTSRSAAAGHVNTEFDQVTGAILARNPWSTAFPGRIAFANIGADPSAWTGDRTEFLGLHGNIAAPVGIGQSLSGNVGAALDPCAVFRRILTLAPGESVEVVMLLGQAASVEAVRDIIARTRKSDLNAVLDGVQRYWSDTLAAVQVTTPDRSFDIMLNGWLMYQTLACRIWARAGFYQASGAYGFRDQLQDGMALTFSQPAMTREHLLRAGSRQFPEGDVQHWWLPHSGQGVRTRISDDRVWLGYAAARYVTTTSDVGVLDEPIGFVEGPKLRRGAHDEFFQPSTSEQSASLFEHCALGLDQCISLTGKNGIPLIGTGDWNDGMNRVGEGGKGTSVWLGWLLIATIAMMAPLADKRDPARAVRWRAHAERVRAAIERHGWDGEWYRRGMYDDGSLLGSATSQECQIDSIAQSWAVLSGAAEPKRAAQAMQSMTRLLIRPEHRIVLLFAPPFDRTTVDPGYIKGYPAGLRENGGQYTHAAMWTVMAHTKLGDGDSAGALFHMLNPINHTLTNADVMRYKVEPYVVAADVYSVEPHAGRGGWTWYTGSAAWMYRAGVEGILGLTQVGPNLLLDPCFPGHWPQVALTVRHGTTRYDILVENPGGSGHGIGQAYLDGKALLHTDGPLVLPLTGGTHKVRVILGGLVRAAA